MFDAVGTVMYPVPTVASVYQAAIRQHCGLDIRSEVVQTTVKASLKTRSAGLDLTTSEESERQFWADLIRDLCPHSDGFQACFDALFDHFGRPESWKCFPDVAGLMDALEDLGLTVAIASNFDHRLNSVCDGLPELANVSQRLISSQVGFRKPAAEFFQAVVEELKLPPQQILMVGDDLVNDVQGAVNAGFRSAWICRSAGIPESMPRDVVVLSNLRELLTLVSPVVRANKMETS